MTEKTTCCFCEFTGNAKGVKVHMALSHPEIMSMRKIVRHGRPPKHACELCGMVHEEVPRPGWATRRRKLNRPKASLIFGCIPPGPAGRGAIIGELKVPEGVKKIKRLLVFTKNPGRITLKVKDPRTGIKQSHVFEVWRGYAVRVWTPVHCSSDGCNRFMHTHKSAR